jgi:thioredoxin reductase (NADPH)
MLAALRSQMGAGFPVDVDTDPVLKARFGEHVPVLMDGDTELCRYHYDPTKFAAYATEIR